MLQRASTKCRQMMQTIQINPNLGKPETVKKLEKAMVNMTILSQSMTKNIETSEKLRQIQQKIEEYRTSSKQGVKINWAPSIEVIKEMKVTPNENIHRVQKTVEKYKPPHKRNMHKNLAPKTPENDEVTVKISNCTKKTSPKTSTIGKPKGRMKPIFTTTRYKVSNNSTTNSVQDRPLQLRISLLK